MAKKKNRGAKRNRANTNNKKASTNKPPVSETTIVKKVDDLHQQKVDVSTVQQLDKQATPNELDTMKEENNLAEAWIKVEQLWKAADASLMEAESEKEEANNKLNEAEKKMDLAQSIRGQAVRQQEEYRKAMKAIKDRESALQGEKASLNQEEIRLLSLKAQAENGFPDLLKERVEDLEAKSLALVQERKKWITHYEQKYEEINQKKEQLSQEYLKKEEALASKHAEKEEKLTQEHAEKKQQLRKRERQLRLDLEIFEEDKEAFEEKIEKHAAYKITQLEEEIDQIKTIKQVKDEKYDDLLEQLRRKEEAELAFGKKSPEEVLKEINALRGKVKDLDAQLADSLHASQKERLLELEKAEEDWHKERGALKSEITHLRKQANNYQLEVGERQSLKERSEHTEARLKLAHANLEELKIEIEGYTEKAKNKETFEFCAIMDDNERLQQPMKSSDEIKSLKEFAEEVRHRIAKAEQMPLYYSQKVIRTFLAGLSIGKLSILQGISGTGKTSLPRAFAKAVHGGCSIIEVQSGWRDRQDLLGYYNTFESKYYESSFFKALYEANCPQYKDAPYFIILDEMNLSHPEHYFADFLSIIEGHEGSQGVVVNAPKKGQLPKLIDDKKSKDLYLPVPKNLWFIGTANHDETTLQFAPKTYDRANIMEMPINPERFAPNKQHGNRILSYTDLRKQFDKAIKTHKLEYDQALNFLKKTLKPELSKLGIGWGNRLENKHLKPFVSVYNATGGKTGDALDHLVATKLLRQIKGRYDLKADKLEALYSKLDDEFKTAFGISPIDSLAIIEKEVDRLS